MRVGTVKPLPADDLRNPEHPSHDEAWLEVARALGRALADRDFERQQQGEKNEGRNLRKDRRPLR